MSVMLLDETKAGSLIQGICQIPGMWGSARYFRHTEYGNLDQYDIRKFVTKLYQANLDTWNKKYGEQDSIIDILPITGKPFNKYQTLKTLECLRYNIELEYCPKAKKIIDILDTVINDIKSSIIYELPEYQQAEWG